MPTAELPSVAMWYDERGHGEPCVLLHPGGAGVDSRALGPTVDALALIFRVYTPEQRGHGRTPDVAGPASFERMAANTSRRTRSGRRRATVSATVAPSLQPSK